MWSEQGYGDRRGRLGAMGGVRAGYRGRRGLSEWDLIDLDGLQVGGGLAILYLAYAAVIGIAGQGLTVDNVLAQMLGIKPGAVVDRQTGFHPANLLAVLALAIGSTVARYNLGWVYRVYANRVYILRVYRVYRVYIA